MILLVAIEDPDQTVDAQADQGFLLSHMREKRFCMACPIYIIQGFDKCSKVAICLAPRL